MTKKYFGTDGIRGKTGEYPITPEFFIKLGFAAGKVLTKSWNNKKKPAVVIGKDTRISGYMLESALESGFSSAGVDVFLTGPIPTPAIAYLTKTLKAQIGVVISASHNSWAGILYDGKKMFKSKDYQITHIVDRVGAGDSFMGGLIYGILNNPTDDQTSLDFAVAASCLKHTIKGDANLVSVDEVNKLMNGDSSGRVNR